jgi:uncharacterized membrane protein YkvA (DUF1232 family)
MVNVLSISWQLWALVALGGLVLVWCATVLVLVGVGRRTQARALAGLVPDCAVLLKRLLHDPRLPRRDKLIVLGAAGYLALPFDLVPDFVPVAGQLDDAIVVVFVLRRLLRSDERAVRELWPGPERSLELLLRLSRASPRATPG